MEPIHRPLPGPLFNLFEMPGRADIQPFKSGPADSGSTLKLVPPTL